MVNDKQNYSICKLNIKFFDFTDIIIYFNSYASTETICSRALEIFNKTSKRVQIPICNAIYGVSLKIEKNGQMDTARRR